MDIYKVDAVTRIANNPYLYIIGKHLEVMPVRIPSAYHEFLHRGMIVCVHKNHSGDAIAYTFGEHIVFMSHPINRDEIRSFFHQMRDIYSFSLDSLCFKYRLRRALRKRGMVPSRSMVTNMVVYNLCMGFSVPER